MYRCDVCDCVVPANTACNKIVVETRVFQHPERADVYWHPPKAGGKGEWVDDPGGPGSQIVREVRACPACAANARAPA